MASGIYNSAKVSFLKGEIVALTDTFKMALLASTYTPDFDVHDNFDDVSAHEVAGAGYTAGGKALTTKTVTQDNVNNRGVFDCDDVQWAASTLAGVRYGAIYKDTGTPSTSKLIALIDFTANRSSSGTTFYVQIPSEGAFYAG